MINFEIIHNAIDINKFTFSMKERIKIRETLSLNDKHVIGCIGWINKNKNQDYLISIMPRIKKCNKKSILLLIGDGDERYNLELKTRQLNIENDVIFFGQSNEVCKLMNALDVIAVPSVKEGLSFSLIEAQANGICCVTSEAIPKDALINENVYTIPLQNTEGWVQALSENTKRIIDVSLLRARGYDIALETQKLEKLYIDFLKAEHLDTSSVPVRILHINGGTMDNGGISSFLMNYYRNINRDKIQFDFAVHGDVSVYDAEIEKLGGTIYYLPLRRKNPCKYSSEISRIMDNKKYYIIHSHMSAMNGYILRKAYNKSIPIRISHCHRNGYENINLLKTMQVQYYKSLIPNYATALWACSTSAGEWLYA